MMTSLPPGMKEVVCVCVYVCKSVVQVCVDVDLLLDPGGKVRHVAVNSRSEHFTETHAAPRRQAKQCPVTVLLLTHQRTATVTLNAHTHTHT